MITNDEIFIVGGGPSLKGFPFEQLKDRNTIAVNVAAFDVPNPTYCITADSSIFRKVQEGRFKEIDTTWVIVLTPNHPVMQFKDGRIQRRNSNFVYNPFCVNIIIKYMKCEGLGFSFKDFRTGYNSGFCAFQLAVLLRYKKIYLLGFDLNLSPNSCHYHKRYKHRRINNKDLQCYFDNFKLAFEIIKKKTNIEVFSCSKTSRLNQLIPYVPFEELIK